MNKLVLCFVLLAFAGFGPASASVEIFLNPKSGGSVGRAAVDGEAPWFCHDQDCPKYEVKHTCDDWEEREYEQARNFWKAPALKLPKRLFSLACPLEHSLYTCMLTEAVRKFTKYRLSACCCC